MNDTPAAVKKRRRIAPIWVVPIVAVLLGLWMVVYTYRNQGPDITIVFSTAEGIEAGKTKVKSLSVAVGLVTSVHLGEDLDNVVVTARLERSAIPLLREDTQFWVVRPRVGMGGVSGLGTIMSGGFIELAPGTGPEGRREFAGLDEVPVTPAGTPGLHFRLVGQRAGSVSAGDPILFRGFEVGRVETAEFDLETHQMRYGAFIQAPYDGLVTDETRFWNASGLSFSASAEGIDLNTGSLQSLLLGGIAFGLPEGIEPGEPVATGKEFVLYPNYKSVTEQPYHHSIEYVLEFAQSVRGLKPGAPVEYRGLVAGQVERLLIEEMVEKGARGRRGVLIPVLIRLEPGRLAMGDSEEGVSFLSERVEARVRDGLRATLSTGNLLTGSLYVSLDMYPDEAPAELGSFAGRSTIPTTSSGLESIQQQVAALLDKLNALPLEDVAASADETIQELDRTVAEARLLLASQELQSLPASLQESLAEFDSTLQSVRQLASTLEQQPNSLIFSREPEMDPQPLAGAP
jgi:paraquat-inducible protein B